MSTVLPTAPLAGVPTIGPTMADLQHQLGDIPPQRILMRPPPGMATEEDLLEAMDRKGAIHELIDGTLVEKAMGYFESHLAAVLIHILSDFISKNDLGILLAEQGTLRILPDQIRAADVAFLSWDRFSNRRLPRAKVPNLAPDLAVEVLSEGNTEAEMARKRREYFNAGVGLVWIIDPESQTARIFTALDEATEIDREGILSGGNVLPGFELKLGDLFDRAGQRESE